MRLIFNYGRERELDAGGVDRPMSGIRAAAVGLAGALAKRGHEVHLVARCPNPGTHEGVHFHDRLHFADLVRTRVPDVLIAIPEVLPLLMPVPARARILWSGNAFIGGDAALSIPWTWPNGPGPQGGRARLYGMDVLGRYIDRVVVGSRWHAGLLEAQGLPPGLTRVSYLGIPLEHYRGPALPHHPHRLVYTSQFRRGLPVLLEIFPRIRNAVPDAELHIFGYEYKYDGMQPDVAGARQPGVFWRGCVSKSQLARELRMAGIMPYPCKFQETFCLSVAEAQAAGLPVVSTDLAALAERVDNGVDGVLIPGRPTKRAYQEAFVAAVVRLLQDDALRAAMGSSAGAKASHAYDWHRIARDWEEDLTQLVAGQSHAPPVIDPTLDLLHPTLLEVRYRDVIAHVPPDLASHCLREEWASYGYDRQSIPGTPSGAVSATAIRRQRVASS